MGITKTSEQLVQDLTELFGGNLPEIISDTLRDELNYGTVEENPEWQEMIDNNIATFCDAIVTIKTSNFDKLTVWCGYTDRLMDVAKHINKIARGVGCELLYVGDHIGTSHAGFGEGRKMIADDPKNCRGKVCFECSDPLAAIILTDYLMGFGHCGMFSWRTITDYEVKDGNLILDFDTESG
nr:hypothetical protein K-LCC10_0239 [Kaumoebavirus]